MTTKNLGGGTLTTTTTTTLPRVVEDDLALSGLHASDIQARFIGTPERSALDIPHGIPGYLIPYWDIDGNPTPHYRARLFDFGQKYRQPKGKGNAVYFPHSFKSTLNGHKYVIITEGEKKAAAANRIGLPAIALGGVYSWRNKTITLPDTAVVAQKGALKGKGSPIDLTVGVAHGPQNLQIRLPSEFDGDSLLSEYAEGFQALTDLVIERALTIFICFDCTPRGTLKAEIAKAAARLALELRFLGIPYLNIKSLPLPLPAASHDDYGLNKVGLDDFIQANRQGTLEHLIDIALKAKRDSPEHKAFAFPLHPSMREFVSKKLQSGRMPRREMGLLGLAITADLDANGKRLRSKDGLMYYFDSNNHKLIRATSPMRQGPVILDDQFTTLLYRRYSLNQNDSKILKWVTTQYTAEDPIEAVEPRRSVFTRGDTLFYQINNSQFVKVSAKEVSLHYNGSEETLFQSEVPQGAEICPTALEASLCKQQQTPLTPWWYETLQQTRLKGVLTGDPKLAVLTTLLFYASPWLLRWRNTQLPVELVTGEAGSGKSTLYGLRQVILQGSEDLKNSPKDLQGWAASVLSMGGLHVIDNLSKDMDKGMKQQLADEMSRITTEPRPTIEMRRYYTEHELIKVPVHATFAVTSLAVPFPQNDLIQRSLHIAFDKASSGPALTYDSGWATTQLEQRGGRTEWVAHHLLVMQRFFQEAAQNWAPIKAQYRLINFEQICTTLARVLGWESWIPHIPSMLASMTQRTLSESDWVLEGILAYVEHMRDAISTLRGTSQLDRTYISTTEIVQWCSMEEDYQECIPLTSARKLSRYMASNESTITQLAGLKKSHVQSGKQYYLLGREGLKILS